MLEVRGFVTNECPIFQTKCTHLRYHLTFSCVVFDKKSVLMKRNISSFHAMNALDPLFFLLTRSARRLRKGNVTDRESHRIFFSP